MLNKQCLSLSLSLSNIPQYSTLEQQCAHFQYDVLWDMGQMHCGICEILLMFYHKNPYAWKDIPYTETWPRGGSFVMTSQSKKLFSLLVVSPSDTNKDLLWQCTTLQKGTNSLRWLVLDTPVGCLPTRHGKPRLRVSLFHGKVCFPNIMNLNMLLHFKYSDTF